MIKIFIGGSRKVARLSKDVQEYIDRIIKDKDKIIVGDANGVDKTIQTYLGKLGYHNVEVFCMENGCRNNIGSWLVREVYAPTRKKDLAYYSLKDEEMAKEASIGFMVWDGKSFGTLANIYRLIQQKKKVDVYMFPIKTITTLTDENDWDNFIIKCDTEIQNKINDFFKIKMSSRENLRQGNLFEILPQSPEDRKQPND